LHGFLGLAEGGDDSKRRLAGCTTRSTFWTALDCRVQILNVAGSSRFVISQRCDVAQKLQLHNG